MFKNFSLDIQKILSYRRWVLREVCKVPVHEHEFREINCFYCKEDHIKEKINVINIEKTKHHEQKYEKKI